MHSNPAVNGNPEVLVLQRMGQFVGDQEFRDGVMAGQGAHESDDHPAAARRVRGDGKHFVTGIVEAGDLLLVELAKQAVQVLIG